MLILIANDDGIDSPGLHALRVIGEKLAGPDGEVWVSAPEQNHSGAGHSLSLNEPVRIRKVDERAFAVRGTPTDSVIMGVHHVLKGRRPDLILSGINRGSNLAEDVTYSGTIAAAMEGTLLGVRSIALSVVRPLGGLANWEGARRYAPGLLRSLIESEQWPEGSFLNINFPECPVDEISGVRITRQGRRPPGAFSIDGRVDSRNVPYYWVKMAYPKGENAPDHDLRAIAEKAVSVTPLQMDLTHYAWQSHLHGLIKL